MRPIEIVELMIVGVVIVGVVIVGVVIVVIIIISLFLKEKLQKIALALALVVITAYSIFYVVRPFWIDTQINRKVELIEPYLVEHFPGEKWIITTVDHRYFKNKHKSPYTISVTFKSEPDVTYDYTVESKDNIYQSSFSSTTNDKRPLDFKHRK
jgi:Zn-dependent protease with chaperone function